MEGICMMAGYPLYELSMPRTVYGSSSSSGVGDRWTIACVGEEKYSSWEGLTAPVTGERVGDGRLIAWSGESMPSSLVASILGNASSIATSSAGPCVCGDA